MSGTASACSGNGHFGNGKHLLEAPEILWTWLETSPGVTIGSIRPVWIIEQLMRQKASERPVKVPRDRRKREGLLTNMMCKIVKEWIQSQESNMLSPYCRKETAADTR